MFTVTSPGRSSSSGEGRPQRLPVRWVVIAILTATAAAVAFAVSGLVPAIMVGCAVATAGHRLIA